MTESDYTVKVLEPQEGFWLTQKAEVDIMYRTLSKQIFLAANDSADNWKEISDADAEEVRRLQKEKSNELNAEQYAGE